MSIHSSHHAPSGRAEPVTSLHGVQSGFISKELKTLHLVPMTAAGTRRQPISPAETTARNNRRREERGQTGFSSEQGPSGLEGIIGNFRKCWNKGAPRCNLRQVAAWRSPPLLSRRVPTTRWHTTARPCRTDFSQPTLGRSTRAPRQRRTRRHRDRPPRRCCA